MKIRSYLYGTNPEKLMTLNYPEVNPPTAVTFDL
jgi:hypothetical protein